MIEASAHQPQHAGLVFTFVPEPGESERFLCLTGHGSQTSESIPCARERPVTMAAQGYYNDAQSNPPAYDHHGPPSESFSRVSPSPRPSPSPVGYNHNAAPYYQSPDDLHDPHHLRYSQQSIGSDSGAYVAGGRIHDNDQYAENIPLKSANPYDNQDPYDNHPPGQQPWMQQPTHYAPDPAMMETQTHPPQKKKKGFFKKKIPFVTYILTAAQIIVFIVELVKAGKSFAGCIDRGSI